MLVNLARSYKKMSLLVLASTHKSHLQDPSKTSVLQGLASTRQLLGLTKYTCKDGFLGNLLIKIKNTVTTQEIYKEVSSLI
jgi:hypothetical protein